MTGPADREFAEIPIFPGLGSASVSFAFELVGRGFGVRGKQRTAYRLLALSEAMERDADSDAADVHELLVEPVRSFLDDVTNGPPGVNGRPLLFLASGAAPEDESRHVTVVRPDHWDYEFEGEVTRLHVPPEKRRIAMLLRDSFCVFESGRVYYVLTLAQPSGQPLDEYSAIHFEQLVLGRIRAARAGYLGFEWPTGATGTLSLVDLANARLRSLREPAKGDPPNGITGIMKPYGLLAPYQFHETLGSEHLANLCVAIEDEALLASAEHAHALFDRNRAGPPPVLPAAVSEAERKWREAGAQAGIAPEALHAQAGNAIPRPMLAVAGLATGVPDFPYQDDSEVHDSTRGTARSTESALFTHPRFMLEIGKSWRSFRESGDTVGTCPYLLMTWLVCVHDEETVTDMERMLEAMIYDPAGKLDALPVKQRFRAEPLQDVMELLHSASSPWGQKTGVQERNLSKRLQLFRWESIHRCGDMFRYPKEKGALAAVRAAMGTDTRFDEVHATLDRFEALVEDVASLASSYSDRRTNRLLGALAVLGLVSIPGNLSQGHQALESADANIYGLITAVVVLALLGLYFLKRSGVPRD